MTRKMIYSRNSEYFCKPSRMSNNPAVTGFYHDESGSIAYVVADPATRHAAIIDPVLDFDEKSGADLDAHRRRDPAPCARAAS